MSETNGTLNAIILAGGLFGSVYLFSTGLVCVNQHLYSDYQKNKFPIYFNLVVMGLSGLTWATIFYKKSDLFFK